MRTARFQEIRNRAVAVVDRVFAQPLRLSPMEAGATDPVRQQHEFEAPLRVMAGKGEAPDGGGGKGWTSRIAAGTAIVAIDPRTYVGPAIRQGDRIRDLTLTGVVYEVSRVDDRDSNRLVLELTET